MRCFCFSWAVFATRAFAIGGYRCSEAYISSFTIYWRYNLKMITIDECRSSLDWLVDHVLATSPPHDLYCIQYETDLIPFLPPAFSHLLDIKKLVIQPPSDHDSKWSSIMCHPSYICSGPFMTKIPVFAAWELPHLHVLRFAIIFLGDRFKPAWVVAPVNATGVYADQTEGQGLAPVQSPLTLYATIISPGTSLSQMMTGDRKSVV